MLAHFLFDPGWGSLAMVFAAAVLVAVVVRLAVTLAAALVLWLLLAALQAARTLCRDSGLLRPNE